MFRTFKVLTISRLWNIKAKKIGTVTLKVNPGYLFWSKIPRVSNCPRLTLGAWQGCMYLGCCSHLRGPAPAITPLNGPQCVIKRLAQWLCKYGLLAHRRDFCLFSLLWYMAIRFKKKMLIIAWSWEYEKKCWKDALNYLRMIFDKHLVNIAKGTMDPTSAEKAENPKKLTGSKIGVIFWQITSRITRKIWKSGTEGIFS